MRTVLFKGKGGVWEECSFQNPIPVYSSGVVVGATCILDHDKQEFAGSVRYDSEARLDLEVNKVWLSFICGRDGVIRSAMLMREKVKGQEPLEIMNVYSEEA